MSHILYLHCGLSGPVILSHQHVFIWTLTDSQVSVEKHVSYELGGILWHSYWDAVSVGNRWQFWLSVVYIWKRINLIFIGSGLRGLSFYLTLRVVPKCINNGKYRILVLPPTTTHNPTLQASSVKFPSWPYMYYIGAHTVHGMLHNLFSPVSGKTHSVTVNFTSVIDFSVLAQSFLKGTRYF